MFKSVKISNPFVIDLYRLTRIIMSFIKLIEINMIGLWNLDKTFYVNKRILDVCSVHPY